MTLIYRIYASLYFRLNAYKKRFNTGYYTWLNKKIVAKFGTNLKINNKCMLTPNTFLGNNANFNGMSVSGNGKVVIGDNFHSGSGCKLITSFHNYEGVKIPYDTTVITKDIIIGDNVWIGDDVIILGGVSIEEGVIVQAGSVVVTNVPKYAIIGGHPAKVFKYRDVERYNKLKDAKEFH